VLFRSFSIVWQETAGFIIMIVILMVRPHGLFGQRSMRVG
jgi:branched-subunit amino acid ABC-type transport system permease component